MSKTEPGGTGHLEEIAMVSKYRFSFVFAAMMALMLTAFSFHTPPDVKTGYSAALVSVDSIVPDVPVFLAADRVAAFDNRSPCLDRIDAHRQVFVTSNQPGQPWRIAASLGFNVIDPHIRA